MLSQTVEYALRAVVCLAQNAPDFLTTEQVAERTQVPPSYLSKVLQLLVRAEIVRAVRGLRGGYMLRVPPDELTLLRVVNAIDPIRRIRRCPLELAEHADRLCPLHKQLDDVLEQTERTFGQTRISDLLRGDSAGRTPLCSVAPVACSKGSNKNGGCGQVP